MDSFKNNEFYDVLNEYYQLKSNYEKKNQEIKNGIIKDSLKSWKEKRAEFQKWKPKCINCKRPVGTRFTRNYDNKEMATTLKAVCGSLSEPCGLHIELKSTQCGLYPEIIQHFEKEMNQDKLDVIIHKNKLIFGYMNAEEAVQKFDELKETIQDTSEMLAYYLDEYIQLVDSKEKNNEINEMREKSFLMIHDMKELIQKYDANHNNPQLIQDVVTIYVNQLQPLLKELQEKKYKKNRVEYNSETGTFHLIQEKTTLNEITFYYSTPEVVAFSKTAKKYEETKKETKKEIPEVEQTEALSTRELEELPEYQQIWNKLDERYKSYLEKDPEWKKETMNAYVEAKREKRQRELILPSDIILPPIVEDNGDLDFGNETFNEIIKILPKEQVKIADLKNQKNLKLLENQLKQMLRKEFLFTKF